MNGYAPIVLFVYNRPWHTKQTIESLQTNTLAKYSDLYVFSDAPKSDNDVANVHSVRNYVRNIKGFKKLSIVDRNENWGLANSIIDGVSRIIDLHEKIIVLEDDLVTSRHFLNFMNVGLETFFHRNDIFSVTGFNLPSHFMKFPSAYNQDIFLNIRPMSWSWATWKNRWTDIDWDVHDFEFFIKNRNDIRDFNRGGTDLTDLLRLQHSGKIDSWYIRWTYSAFRRGLLTVYPKISYVNNVGHDGTGVHCGIDERNIFSHNELSDQRCCKMNYDIELVPRIVNSFNRAFDIKLRSKVKRITKNILRLS